MNAFWMVLGVMILSGALGGLINFFSAEFAGRDRLPWWQHITIGVGAALTIPLFLNSISATLITDILGTKDHPADRSKIFVLVGFCVLAATFSRRFLSSISDKIFAALKKTEREALDAKSEAGEAKMEATVAKEVAQNAQKVTGASPYYEADTLGFEKGGSNEHGIEFTELTDEFTELTDPERAILKALVTSRFSLRSMSGIANDSGFNPVQVNKLIAPMKLRGLIDDAKGSSGQPRWFATPKGRAIISQATENKQESSPA